MKLITLASPTPFFVNLFDSISVQPILSKQQKWVQLPILHFYYTAKIGKTKSFLSFQWSKNGVYKNENDFSTIWELF